MVSRYEMAHLRRSPKRAHKAKRNFAGSSVTPEPCGQPFYDYALRANCANGVAHRRGAALPASKRVDAAHKAAHPKKMNNNARPFFTRRRRNGMPDY